MRRPAILAGAWVVGTSGAAVANPIMAIDLASGQQFPHTAHVQLTRESTSSSLSTVTITRDGEVVTATPLRYQTTTVDVGSGLTDTVVRATTCDCNVPIGQHSYGVDRWNFQVEVVDAAATDGAVPYFSAACDTACASVAPEPAAGGSAGEGGAGAPAAGVGGASGASGAGGAAGASGGTTLAGGTGGGSVGGRTGSGGATSSGGSTSAGGMATGGMSETGGAATGGTHSVPPTSETGGESSGSATPGAGGKGSEDAPATGGSDVSSAGAPDTAGAAPVTPPAEEHSHSSGCALSPTRGRLVPFGILAALGLLAWRRKATCRVRTPCRQQRA
ncbi:MAG: hypothetical protein JW940_02400 [Polyangiaceae bacterium]|nr:hypothetical protein [Polyangiaceae bacterium]